MFTFNSGAPPSNAGGFGATVAPAYSNQIASSAAPPVFGPSSYKSVSGPGVATAAAAPLAAIPVFGGSGGHSFSAPSTGILANRGTAAGVQIAPATGGLPPPPPPVYSSTVPATTAPVFGSGGGGGGRPFGLAAPSFVRGSHNNNSRTTRNQNSGMFSGSRTPPMAQRPPTTHPPAPSEGNQNRNTVFDSTAQPQQQPPPIESGAMPAPQHRKFNMTAAADMSFGVPTASATAHAGNSFEAASTDGVLPTEPTTATTSSIAPRAASSTNRNNGQSSVLGAAFLSRNDTGKAPQPFSSSPLLPSSASSSSAFRSSVLSTAVTVERSVGQDPNADDSNSGRNIQDSSSSFTAPFNPTAKPAALVSDANTQAAPSSFRAPPSSSFSATPDAPVLLTNIFNTTTTAATTSLPINTNNKESGILGNTSTVGSAPSTAAFGAATAPAATAATQRQPQPPPSSTLPATTSVFAADKKMPVLKSSSAFAPDINESKFSASTTSVFAPSAAAVASSIPVKSAFGASAFTPSPSSQSFHAALPAAGTSDGPNHPARGSAFGAVLSSSSSSLPSNTKGGRGQDGGGSRRNRRRGRSPPPTEHAEGRAVPLPRSAARPAHIATSAPPSSPQQQTQRLTTDSRLEKLPLPSLPSDEKQWSLAARVCKSFLLQLASSSAMGVSCSSASRETGAAEALEQAFFGVAGREGVTGDFRTSAGEMLAVWQTSVRPVLAAPKASNNEALPFPGEMWVALFALGTYLNTIISTLASPSGASLASTRADLAAYKVALRANPVEALTDACHYANELNELLQMVFQRGGEAEAPPYSILPVVLRRVRTVFDEANARGVATVQSNLNVVTSKLFAVLNRRVKSASVQVPHNTTNNPTDKPPRWFLTFDSREKESLLHSFAYLVSEMIAVDAPMNEDVELFITAFHECLPSALAERCMLYYRCACALLRQPLRMQQMATAAELLAKALAVYPPDAPPANKRVLEVKLLTAELALGCLPSDKDRIALDVPQLIDVVNALKTSRLDLLDAALKVHGPFFVQIGVYNALRLARQRVALLMVVKYYVTHGCEKRLNVEEMVRYHRLPYSSSEAGMIWLLPLLVEKQMNGVLDHGYLILSGTAPFDEYPRELLASAEE